MALVLVRRVFSDEGYVPMLAELSVFPAELCGSGEMVSD